MKHTLVALLLLCGSAFAAESTRDRLIAALAVMADEPQEFGTKRYEEAVKILSGVFEREVPKLSLSDEAVAWVPAFGPCGGPGSPLLLAFFASVLRDHLQGTVEGSTYRGWLAAIRHYRFLRSKYPEDYPPVEALEGMIKKDSSGALREEASALERKTKGPNKAPEPTPMSVTPRANARVAPAIGVAHL